MKYTLSDFKEGQEFTATYNNEIITGKIKLEVLSPTCKRIYACQNVQSGATANNKLGYNHSWCLLEYHLEEEKKDIIENLVMGLFKNLILKNKNVQILNIL
jgi:hypothetical protein